MKPLPKKARLRQNQYRMDLITCSRQHNRRKHYLFIQRRLIKDPVVRAAMSARHMSLKWMKLFYGTSTYSPLSELSRANMDTLYQNMRSHCQFITRLGGYDWYMHPSHWGKIPCAKFLQVQFRIQSPERILYGLKVKQ